MAAQTVDAALGPRRRPGATVAHRRAAARRRGAAGELDALASLTGRARRASTRGRAGRGSSPGTGREAADVVAPRPRARPRSAARTRHRPPRGRGGLGRPGRSRPCRSTTSSPGGRASPRSWRTAARRSRRGWPRSSAAELGWDERRPGRRGRDLSRRGAPRVRRARRPSPVPSPAQVAEPVAAVVGP